MSGLGTKRTNSGNMSRLMPVAESEAKLFSSEIRDFLQMNSLLFSKSKYFLVMLSNSLGVSGLEAKRTNSRNMSRLIPVAESEAKLFSSEIRDYYQ